MKGHLTRREQRFLDHYIETGDLGNSAKHAGYKRSSISSYSQKGRDILNNLKSDFKDMMEEMGLTDRLLCQKVLEGLNAYKTIFASYEGKFLDQRDCVDFSARAKYTEQLARMKGVFLDRVQHEGKDGGDIVLQLSPRVPQCGRTTKKEISFEDE